MTNELLELKTQNINFNKMIMNDPFKLELNRINTTIAHLRSKEIMMRTDKVPEELKEKIKDENKTNRKKIIGNLNCLFMVCSLRILNLIISLPKNLQFMDFGSALNYKINS